MSLVQVPGAYNAVARLHAESRRCGVIAFSSGNHAQAVAMAARLLGSRAVVVMPADRDTPPSKVTATVGYGAEIVTFDRYTDDRFQISDQLSAERGLTLIPPYDHTDVIAGAGTTAAELVDDLDVLVVPLGGGGQVAGCATVLGAIAPTTRIVGVETEAGDKNRRSLRAGQPVRSVPRTIADGVTGERTGMLTFPIIQRLVDDVVVVSDQEILTAMAFLFDRRTGSACPASCGAACPVCPADRDAVRGPATRTRWRRRPVAMILGALVLLAIIVLTILGVVTTPAEHLGNM